MDDAGNVLDPGKAHLARGSDKKTFLFDVDDALVGDDPDVEVVVDPDQKTEEPEKDEKSILDEKKKSEVARVLQLRKKVGQDHVASDKERRQDDDNQEMKKNIKPVPVDHVEDHFGGVLSGETIGFAVDIHPVRVLMG